MSLHIGAERNGSRTLFASESGSKIDTYRLHIVADVTLSGRMTWLSFYVTWSYRHDYHRDQDFYYRLGPPIPLDQTNQ